MADPIDSIVTVNISAQSATPTLPSVQIPSIIGYHTKNTDAIRSYSSLADLTGDGFTANDPIYKVALAIVSQSPRPNIFKVIRGTTSVAQVMHFKVTDSQNGHVVGLNVTNASGVVVPIFNTNSSQTAAQIATALAAVVVAGATLVVDGGDNTQVNITISASGALWYPSGIFGGNFTDVTPTASPGTDLDAALLVDPNFYGVSGTWMDTNNIQAINTWVVANKRYQFYTTADEANEVTPPSGVMGTLKTAGSPRSLGQFSGTPMAYAGAALMSEMLVANPGSLTGAYKTLIGVPVDTLTTTQEQNITGNNGNYYTLVAGLNLTIDGRGASGLYADIQIGIDALTREIKIRVMTLLARLPKVPYTRAGIAMVGAEVLAAIKSFIPTGFISNDSGFEPSVSLPDISTIAPADKTARILRNVNFTCVAQGAIQTVIVNGTVAV